MTDDDDSNRILDNSGGRKEGRKEEECVGGWGAGRVGSYVSVYLVGEAPKPLILPRNFSPVALA